MTREVRCDGARSSGDAAPVFPMPDSELLIFLEREGIQRVQNPDEWREFSMFIAGHFSGARSLAVVEIGTQSGGTYFSLYNMFYHSLGILASIDNRFYSRIDMAYPREHYAGEYRRFDRLVGRVRDERLTVIVGDSHSMKVKHELSAALAGKPVDLCFIDGDHSYEGTRADYLLYHDMVKIGGLICFHDIAHAEEKNGFFPVNVRRFWGEIKTEYRSHEFIHSADRGIGVIEL